MTNFTPMPYPLDFVNHPLLPGWAKPPQQPYIYLLGVLCARNTPRPAYSVSYQWNNSNCRRSCKMFWVWFCAGSRCVTMEAYNPIPRGFRKKQRIHVSRRHCNNFSNRIGQSKRPRQRRAEMPRIEAGDGGRSGSKGYNRHGTRQVV
jgi:hypothetical protein